MREKHYRSFAKAVSYRITGSLYTILISYLITRQIAMALSIGLVELFTKIFIYYFHERVWNGISFGRHTHPEDYQI